MVLLKGLANHSPEYIKLEGKSHTNNLIFWKEATGKLAKKHPCIKAAQTWVRNEASMASLPGAGPVLIHPCPMARLVDKAMLPRNPGCEYQQLYS